MKNLTRPRFVSQCQMLVLCSITNQLISTKDRVEAVKGMGSHPPWVNECMLKSNTSVNIVCCCL